jgi:hypothetical protein
MTPQSLLRLLILAVALLAAPTAGRAATVPLTLEQLMAVADAVVAVRVVDTKSQLADGRITTTADLQVIESFKGALAGRQQLTYLGGHWRQMVMAVPDIPTLTPGEEAVLFLSRPADRLSEKAKSGLNLNSPLIASMQIVGGHQGKFLIVNREGNPELKARTGDAKIPALHKIRRTATLSGAKVDDAPNYSEFAAALHQLAARQAEKAAAKGPREAIDGIVGRFAIPDKSADPLLRRFDPLPSIAYSTDAELEQIKAQIKTLQEQAASGPEAN